MYAYDKSAAAQKKSVKKRSTVPSNNTQPIQRVIIIGQGKKQIICNRDTPPEKLEDLINAIEAQVTVICERDKALDGKTILSNVLALFDIFRNEEYYEASYTNILRLANFLIAVATGKKSQPLLVDPELFDFICSNIIHGAGFQNMAHLLLRQPERFFDLRVKKYAAIRNFLENPKKIIYHILMDFQNQKKEFWGKQAILDEVSKAIFDLFPDIDGESRPQLPYQVEYSANFDGALHHRIPWSQLSTDKTQSDRALLCWGEDNLLAGPRQERLFDPGSSFDVEADEVWSHSEQTFATRTIPTDKCPSTSRTETIRRETPEYHLRTRWMQRIFEESHSMLQLLEDIQPLLTPEDSTPSAKQHEAKTRMTQGISNFKTSLLIAITRFNEVEIEFRPYSQYLSELYQTFLPESIDGSDIRRLISSLKKFQLEIKEQAQKQEEAFLFSAHPTGDAETDHASSSTTPSTADILDYETMLPRSTIDTIREHWGPGTIYNPPSTRNNCFFAALLGNEERAQEAREQIRSIIHQGLRDGDMVDYRDLIAMFHQDDHTPSAVTQLFHIPGIHVYDLYHGQLRHVSDFGTITEDSPILICIESAHYIRFNKHRE